MKILSLVCPLLAILLLTGCSTARPEATAPGYETVMITYHPKAGNEDQFQATLAQAWQVYRSEDAVFAKPHVVIRDTEDGNETRFIEIFTWRKSPDHPSAAIKDIWKKEQSLCEARDGHTALEGGEVQLVSGK